MSRYAIIENNLIINVVESDDDYGISQGWIKLDDVGGIGWTYKDGKFTPPPAPEVLPEQIMQANEFKAKALLANSDWVEYPSTTDISKNPHLTNLDEWIDYRVALRAIVINPPSTEITDWPVEPSKQWSTQ